ncbi:MAG: ATP-dependent 6-phosphofructokinase [Clostridiales bacterium]|nr:ATP-dependent 6-phosphofructokinase [Clostridiales bacterium]
MKNVAILTSGGDSQGMNAYISKLVGLLVKNKINVYGIKRGFQGLLDEDFIKLNLKNVENISFLGGSVLKTARCTEFYEDKGVEKGFNILKNHKIDCLVVLGGNGSFKGALNLIDKGMNVICIPGTIDNDLFYSDISLGFDTAVNNAVDTIEKIKQTMLSNNRGIIVEVMGRNCGNIALNTALSVNANALIINEDKKSIKNAENYVKNAILNGVESPLIVLQENIMDGQKLADKFQKKFKKQFKFEHIGYIQRGGEPTVKDKIFANLLAIQTMNSILKGEFNIAIGMQKESIFNIPLKEALTKESNFNKNLYELYLSNL